jgi:hypothetical protein
MQQTTARSALAETRYGKDFERENGVEFAGLIGVAVSSVLRKNNYYSNTKRAIVRRSFPCWPQISWR